jgi:hypothetical protein
MIVVQQLICARILRRCKPNRRLAADRSRLSALSLFVPRNRIEMFCEPPSAVHEYGWVLGSRLSEACLFILEVGYHLLLLIAYRTQRYSQGFNFSSGMCSTSVHGL